MPAERASLWPRLLKQLGAIAPGIGVWKNTEEALSGRGDIDYFAPRELWPAIVEAFRSWAETGGLEYLPPCLHRPGAMYLLAVDREGERLMQLDVREHLTLAGAEIIDAEALGKLLAETPHGFKALRPGAEATLKLMTKCIDGSGRLRFDCLEEEGVISGIHADPMGALGTVGLLRRGRAAANRLVASVAAGLPEPSEARSLVRGLRAASLLDPRTLASRGIHRLLRGQACPTLGWVLSEGQRLPRQVDRWAEEVRQAHGFDDLQSADPARLHAPDGRRGMFVVVAGPDGVGKTTLRRAITARLRREHTVWSGRLQGPLTARRQRRVGDPSQGADARGTVASMLKIPYLFLDGMLRWLTWTGPWLRRGGWVVTERGWWDIAVYPARYRLPRAGRLHRALGLVGPRPDLVLVLEASPETVLGRKAELSSEEIRRQTEAWRRVIPEAQRHVHLDATLPPDALVTLALQAIEETRSGSVPPSASSRSVANG